MSIREIIEVSDCMCDQLSSPDLAHDPDCPQSLIEVRIELTPRSPV